MKLYFLCVLAAIFSLLHILLQEAFEFSCFFKASDRGIELLGQPGEGIPRGISPDALAGSHWCRGDWMTLLVKKINMRTGIVSRVVSREMVLN